MKWGDGVAGEARPDSLRLLGSVGEPINPEAWLWYHEHIGGGRCPIVDTWWQTETGAIMITPLPGLVTTKPASATRPFPGIAADVVDEQGNPLPQGTADGHPRHHQALAVHAAHALGRRRALPQGLLEQVRGQGFYFAGDGARRDEEGDYWLLGRVDDVMLVAGHNICTMEVESALVDHPAVAEAAVIGRTHEIKGQAIAAFVTVKEGVAATSELAGELKNHVAKKIGAICRPDDILFTAELPKTRSGKIMRRLLRDIAEGRALGDTTTLADPTVVASLKEKYSEEG